MLGSSSEVKYCIFKSGRDWKLTNWCKKRLMDTYNEKFVHLMAILFCSQQLVWSRQSSCLSVQSVRKCFFFLSFFAKKDFLSSQKQNKCVFETIYGRSSQWKFFLSRLLAIKNLFFCCSAHSQSFRATASTTTTATTTTAATSTNINFVQCLVTTQQSCEWAGQRGGLKITEQIGSIKFQKLCQWPCQIEITNSSWTQIFTLH